MKRFMGAALGIVLLGSLWTVSCAVGAEEEIGPAVSGYFDRMFGYLRNAAEQSPNEESFRGILKPVADAVPGFYGATLIDPDFVIRQVYFPSHFLARGFDLKKVNELKEFYRMMQENPAPQLSEPGHGNLMQPGLIAMRYPVMSDGVLRNIVSMMVRTTFFLKETGLDTCRAYKIICSGKVAEQKGTLSADYTEVTVPLPSTEWVIQYER